MRFTHLEKLVLLSLKTRFEEALANGSDFAPPAAGSAEELWTAMDPAYQRWHQVKEVEGGELVKERLLDVVGCSETDLRVTLRVLMQDGLIKANHDWRKERDKVKKYGEKEFVIEGHCFSLTEKGSFICREFEGEI